LELSWLEQLWLWWVRLGLSLLWVGQLADYGNRKRLEWVLLWQQVVGLLVYF
jgi:hypothetical protein